MIMNPVFYACNKHIELDYQLVRECLPFGHLVVIHHIPTNHRIVDLFTMLVYSHTFLG